VAAASIGPGDIVSAPVGHPGGPLWAIAAGAVFKHVLTEGIAPCQLTTGTPALEG
jgi:hypothetical protein